MCICVCLCVFCLTLWGSGVCVKSQRVYAMPDCWHAGVCEGDSVHVLPDSVGVLVCVNVSACF